MATTTTTSQRSNPRIALTLPSEKGLADRDREAIARIRAGVLETGERLRERHPWLARHQDLIGLAIFALAIAGIVANGVLYVAGVMPAWACIALSAFWMSLLHELEHDLIHYLYFKRRPVPHNLMLAGVWLFRPSTINPWIRRRMHLHHHRVSGTESDLEERAITNGEPWGVRRMLMTGDSMLAIYLRPLELRRTVIKFAKAEAGDDRKAQVRIRIEQAISYVPLGLVHWGAWHVFILVGSVMAVASLVGHPVELSGALATGWELLVVGIVVWFAPNVLRTFCLHLVSSNMHYFGDVEPGNVLQQTQVWTAWWLWPLHAFCFNFGGTHAIHHFVVGDPFYIRQAIARDAQAVLRAHGVRFNDFGTFRRANRRGAYQPGAPAQG